MHPQLQAIVDDFHDATGRLHRLVDAVPRPMWPQRPEPKRWSISECVAHLNLTGQAFMPALEKGLDEARGLHREAGRRYRRGPIGWLLWRTMGPPVRARLRTAAVFIPQSAAPVGELVAEFERLQEAQIQCVRAADGLPIDKIGIRSPFNARVRYNLYSALTILPRHQHRHLWQAEQAGRQVSTLESNSSRFKT